MGQTYTSTNPASGVTTFGSLYQIIRDHIDAAITNMVGGTAPSTPSEGWTWYDSTNNVMMAYDGSAWQYIDINTPTYSEVITARGTAGSLNARISASLNPDGSFAGSSPSSDWWAGGTSPWRYYSTIQFEENGDKTAIYTVGRAIYIQGSANPGFTYVTASSYSAATTLVTLQDTILDANMSTPQFGQSDFNYHGRIPWTRALFSNSDTSRDFAPLNYALLSDGAGGCTVAAVLSETTTLANHKKYGVL